MQSGLLSRLIGRPAEVKALPVALCYPPGVLRWELAKGALGGCAGLGILLGFRPAPVLGWPLAGITVLFALYALQQVRRSKARYEVTEHGAVQMKNGTRLEVPWNDLRKLR
ncbi:MAG TPA: hypothetical protein VL359_08535, partial [bacterium]|nr:hypothetical protein [bacterium]